MSGSSYNSCQAYKKRTSLFYLTYSKECSEQDDYHSYWLPQIPQVGRSTSNKRKPASQHHHTRPLPGATSITLLTTQVMSLVTGDAKECPQLAFYMLCAWVTASYTVTHMPLSTYIHPTKRTCLRKSCQQQVLIIT